MPAPACAYISLDVETTGLIPGEDHVYEIALVSFDDEGNELDRFESLIRPLLDPLSKRLAPVAEAPTFEAIAGTILDWLWLAPVVGHNVTFDLAMIDGELTRFGAGLPQIAYIDTLALATAVDLGSPDLRLATLIDFLGLEGADFHTAIADALAASQLLTRLRAAMSGAGGLAPVPNAEVFFGSADVWPNLPGRASPLPRDITIFPAAVRRPNRDEPGLHGTFLTISTVGMGPSPELQRQIDEQTVDLARQGVGAIPRGAQLPKRITAVLPAITSPDFDEALAASTIFLDWVRDPSGEFHAAETDWAAGGFSGPAGLTRLTRIVELFRESEGVALPEAALTLARLKRVEPTCAADEVEAAYRAAFDLALIDDREFNAFYADAHADDEPHEDDEADEDQFETAEPVLDEWLAYLRGIDDQQRVTQFLTEFSDPVWGFSD
jgi:hypothetical protein